MKPTHRFALWSAFIRQFEINRIIRGEILSSFIQSEYDSNNQGETTWNTDNTNFTCLTSGISVGNAGQSGHAVDSSKGWRLRSYIRPHLVILSLQDYRLLGHGAIDV